MATRYTEVEPLTTLTWEAPQGYTFVSGKGLSLLPVTSNSPTAQKIPILISTIVLTVTTIVPSSTLSRKISTVSEDTTAIALSSIASYESIQETATDPWTKEHLSSAISQYTSWAGLSNGYTTTSSGVRSITPGATSENTQKGVDTTLTTVPSITGTDMSAMVLSEILSYESIGATATDAILKGELRSGISQLSKLATLTSGAFANRITITPSEQSAIDHSNKESAKNSQLYTGLIAFAAVVMLSLVSGMVVAYFVRMRRRRRAKFFPPLIQHVAPDLSSFGGLMAEMGREATVKDQDHKYKGVQRVARVPKTSKASKAQSSSREAEISEGIAELPGLTPEMEPLKVHEEFSSQGAKDLEKNDSEMGEEGMQIPRKAITRSECKDRGDEF